MAVYASVMPWDALALAEFTGFTGKRFELEVPLQGWYERYQQGSPLICSSWERFRDPRETTYTKYTELQMEKEIFVDGILKEIEVTGYDRELSGPWLDVLSTLIAPFRYPGHALMMVAAYVAQMAPGGRIAVAATFQAGDEARRVERLAYRIRQVQLAFPSFASDSKSLWERDARWQPLREVVERLLVTYDWGEAFVALNLVLKPVIDEMFLKHASDFALGQGDHLLGQVFYSLHEDCQWRLQWSRALAQTAIQDTAGNREVFQTWIDKRGPGMRPFHDLTCQLEDFCAEYLRSTELRPGKN